ncbi:MAG: molybdopterin-synthase adenylyltransferase MoeB [Thermoanaerobaculia bacterium]
MNPAGHPSLSPSELARYGRQLVLPEVGRPGQERLKGARVLLVGAGGLGSPVALYLAAAGVGRLTLVDGDRVERSNLHRQILYGESDVGRPKLEAAAARLREANPHVEVRPVAERFTAANAAALVADHDVVVDGTDNFTARYLVNDACVLAGKPNVFGSVLRFEGQVSVFWSPRGPCYRCLFPEPPPAGLVPSCAEAGVLGALPGIVGALQANEALKLVLGVGEPLVGRFLVFDALALRFREVALPRSPSCPICSAHPTVTELVEIDAACDLAAPGGEEMAMDLTPREMKQWRDEGRDFVLLDVRTPREHALASLPGALLIPLQELPQRVDELDPAADIVVHCHHGQRSERAAAFLRGQGFASVRNLAGGIDAWSDQVDPDVPRY